MATEVSDSRGRGGPGPVGRMRIAIGVGFPPDIMSRSECGSKEKNAAVGKRDEKAADGPEEEDGMEANE